MIGMSSIEPSVEYYAFSMLVVNSSSALKLCGNSFGAHHHGLANDHLDTAFDGIVRSSVRPLIAWIPPRGIKTVFDLL